jgi:hypothetical protein
VHQGCQQQRDANKSNEAGNSMQGGQQQDGHTRWTHEMAAAAVEKSETFSRDTSNSSRNSQQGMANPYFYIQHPSFCFFYTITFELIRFVLILMKLLKY